MGAGCMGRTFKLWPLGSVPCLSNGDNGFRTVATADEEFTSFICCWQSPPKLFLHDFKYFGGWKPSFPASLLDWKSVRTVQ